VSPGLRLRPQIHSRECAFDSRLIRSSGRLHPTPRSSPAAVRFRVFVARHLQAAFGHIGNRAARGPFGSSGFPTLQSARATQLAIWPAFELATVILETR